MTSPHRLIPYLLMLIPTLLLGSCSDNAEKEPEAPQPDFVTILDAGPLSALPEGGIVMIQFSTNKDWKIEIPATSEHFNGVLEHRYGTPGEISIPYSALPNTGQTARSTTLRITAGRASAEITVNQDMVGVTLPSEQEVRAYLMRLYEATDGPNWRFRGNWGSDLPLNRWGSEVRYENGRLSLNLNERYLKGDIDLSGCKALVSLRCSKNQISRINVSDCPLLTEIDCTNTGLEEIDLSGCLSLTSLHIPYNNLRHLDIGWCRTITNLNVHNCRLESLDLSECVSLKHISCAINRLTTLDIPHRFNLSECFCYENELRSLDLSNSPQLKILNCGDNEISSLSVIGSPRLYWIYCYNNRLTSLDISDQKEVLAHYYCYSNRFTSLDMSGYRNLTELHCSDNALSTLDITGCRHLQWLYCSHNQLETLSFEGLDLSILARIDCSYNRLRVADIASLHPVRLWCQGNRIGGEIPEHFDRLTEFEYDRRYEYRPDTGTYSDHGYGWWYPGEPEKMSHSR